MKSLRQSGVLDHPLHEEFIGGRQKELLLPRFQKNAMLLAKLLIRLKKK